MEWITLKEVLFFVSGTGIVSLIALGKFVFDRYDKVKLDKQQELAQNVSESVEIKRLSMEGKDGQIEELWKMYEEKKIEVSLLRDNQSISRQSLNKLMMEMRSARRELSILESLVIKEAKHSDIGKSVKLIVEHFNRMEEFLP